METKLEPPLKIVKAAVAGYFSPLIKTVSFLRYQSKSLKAFYKRLGMAEKLGFWGSLASITGLLIVFLPQDGNSKGKLIQQETYGDSSPNVIHSGEGDVNIQYGNKEKKHLSYIEPSEMQMKAALLRSMKMRGGVQKKENTIATENPIAGMAIEIVDFEKLGCETATYGSGYICNYKHTSLIGAYSNEGTSAGDKHAQGVNMLMKLMMGGRETVSGTATRRFLKSKSGWIASEE